MERREFIENKLGEIIEGLLAKRTSFWKTVEESPTVLVATGKKECECTSPFCEHADTQEFLKTECPYPSRFSPFQK